MPRRRTPESDECAHITIRCNNKSFFFDLEHCWEDISAWVDSLPYIFDVALHHVVVMSNHMHLLVTPKKNNFGEAMSYFLTNLSKYLNYSHKRINHIFGSRYYPVIINKERHLINVIRYLYQNPQRAGISKTLYDYPYSSLGFYVGTNNPRLRLEPDLYTRALFARGLEGRDEWIEQVSMSLPQDDLHIMRRSLGKASFTFNREQLKNIDVLSTTLVL